MRTVLLTLLWLLLGNYAHAQQNPALVKKAVEDWLRVQSKGLPGQVSIEAGSLDPDNQLMPCRAFDVSRPPGARIIGRSNVQVRCLDEAGWRVYIPVHIRVKAPYLISARPIAQGQLVTEDDLASQIGDLSDLPANILTDAAIAVGMEARTSIPAGRPLRGDLLKPPTVIRQGQSVKIISRGPGFAVTNDGKALNNAVTGQVAQVRLGSGQVVSGIAQANGNVEVSY